VPELPLASDTSPLLYLGRIGQLELLPRLFARVYVPEQVMLELDTGRLLRGDTPDPRSFPWVQVVAVPPELIATLPPNTLGLGERATLAYAVQAGQMRVAVDDRQARRLARRLQLPVVGLIGILLRAKQAGLLPAVQPQLEVVRSKGFYLHPLTYQRALVLAGEAPAD
jgi:predicted nucleic acid-binding protein